MFEQFWQWLQSLWHRWLGTHKSSYERGNTLFRLGRYKEAIAAYDRALQLKSDYQDAKDAHYRVSQISLDPYNSEVWYVQGLALYAVVPYIDEDHKKLSNLEESIFYLDQALQINPSSDSAWLTHAEALFKLGRRSEAISSFDRSLELNPDCDDAWYNRGLAHHYMENYKDALESYERALWVNPNNQEAIRNKKIILNELRRN
jgi:tetratricopeptide (TPR) repeat protein